LTIAYEAELLPDHHWWMEGRARALERVLADRVPAGGPALDAGAGNGFWGERLCGRYDPVSLIEPDSVLQEHIHERKLEASLVGASLPGPLPLPADTFRLVTCLDVIEHIPDDEGTVSELARVTAPNGFLLFTVPAHPHLWSDHDVSVGHQRRYTKEMLTKLITSRGLNLELLAPLNVWLYPAAWMMRKLNRVGDELPNPRVNKMLTSIFGSEGKIVERWPSFMKGLSWLALARKTS
jgi:SAM-dependent methyltransferase